MSLVAMVHSLKTPGCINYVNSASVIRNVLCLHGRERDPNQIFHFMSLNKKSNFKSDLVHLPSLRGAIFGDWLMLCNAAPVRTFASHFCLIVCHCNVTAVTILPCKSVDIKWSYGRNQHGRANKWKQSELLVLWIVQDFCWLKNWNMHLDMRCKTHGFLVHVLDHNIYFNRGRKTFFFL